MALIEELDGSFPPLNVELDVSFLVELLHFFPIDKINIPAGSYDQYLYDLEKTVVDNYDAGNYQVSFFYAHLIFMSYVYYCVDRAYQIKPDRMKDIYYPLNAYNGRQDKPDIEKYSNIYDFSKIPEKEIFKVFRIMGMEDEKIKAFSKYISDRDDYAHATGKGNISEEKLIENVRTIKKNMETLSELFQEEIKGRYVKYLLENAGNDYEAVPNTAFDFMLDNSLSLHDIAYLCNIGISGIRNSNEEFKKYYRLAKRVHCAFIEYCIENEGIEEPDKYQSLKDDFYLLYRYKDQAKDYIEDVLGISSYRCGKEGVEFPLYECPECEEEQLVYDAENGRFHCFACDEDFTTEDLDFCERCGSLMRRDDDWPICKNCTDDIKRD